MIILLIIEMLKGLVVLLVVLLGVAFFTFMERKFLGYYHIRLGPNKVVYGVFQPFSDALKLFIKTSFKIYFFNFFVYCMIPFFGLFLMLFFWVFYPFYGILCFRNLSFLFFFIVRSIGVYFLLISGWGRNRKYRFYGGYRSSAQSISYEIIMVLVLLYLCVSWYSLNFVFSLIDQRFNVGFYVNMVLLLLWVFSILAECNRRPFDFSEGESELVSGFNTEYRGGLFSFIFIGEYRSIMFFCLLTGLLFISGLFSIVFRVFLLVFYLWVRASFPRLRYDLLIEMR